MEIVIFDFEVFKYDVLLGALVLSKDGNQLYQLWDKNEIKKFYRLHYDDLWIGHNNCDYDNFILQAIIDGKDVKKENDRLIHSKYPGFLHIHLNYYDLMREHFGSLKVMEAYMGKNISETEVDFDLDRPLTVEEKELTNRYNQDDLNQTLCDFNYLKNSEIELKLNLLNEFGFDINNLNKSTASLAAVILNAKRIDGIENWKKPIQLYPNLRIDNEEIKRYYLTREYINNNKIIYFGNTPHTLAKGGIHGALEKVYFPYAYYFDVSGYYNLVMINYDLLPRSIPPKGKERYIQMYEDQIKMKKTDPQKRKVYKPILLSVFGAQDNENSDFYDPQQGELVRITGQLFIIDLLEKLSKISIIIQSNTDGIMVFPNKGIKEDQIKDILDEWMKRTKFVLHTSVIYDLYQRDVNNYCYREKDGKIVTKGEALKYYHQIDNPYSTEAYRAKEPLIISYAITDFLINKIPPEETIDKYKDNLFMYQFICKKNSFDWLEIQEDDLVNNLSKVTKLQKVNRCFPRADNRIVGTIYKRKYSGKTTKARYQNTPDNVFIFNEDIRSDENKKLLFSKIDWNYYVERSYERILEFMGDKNE